MKKLEVIIENSVTNSIKLTLAVTLLVTVYARYNISSNTKYQLLSYFQNKHEQSDLNGIAADLGEKARGLPDNELQIIARRIATKYSPDANRELFIKLVSYKENNDAMALGVHIIENCAQFYKNKGAIFLSGLAYSQGKFIAKDLNKAEYYLKDIALKDDRAALYFLGLVYLDEGFARRNASYGLQLVQQAADSGLPLAIKKLAELAKSNTR